MPFIHPCPLMPVTDYIGKHDGGELAGLGHEEILCFEGSENVLAD